jgi:hypothetical protein
MKLKININNDFTFNKSNWIYKLIQEKRKRIYSHHCDELIIRKR